VLKNKLMFNQSLFGRAILYFLHLIIFLVTNLFSTKIYGFAVQT